MCNDFYDKYDEYMNVVAERKDRTMRQTNYSLANVEAGHMADFVEKAVGVIEFLEQLQYEGITKLQQSCKLN